MNGRTFSQNPRKRGKKENANTEDNQTEESCTSQALKRSNAQAMAVVASLVRC